MVSGDDSAKKGTELSLIKESRIDKKLKKKQLRFRYDHFISSKYVAVSWLKGKIYRWG